MGLSTIGVLTCLVSVIISFAGSWVVALILLGLLPVCGLIMMLGARFPSAVDLQVEETHATAGKFTAEAATAIRTVRALGAEEHTLGILRDSLDYVCRSKAAKSWKMGVSVGLNLMLPQVGLFYMTVRVPFLSLCVCLCASLCVCVCSCVRVRVRELRPQAECR